jgi:hypothetical protein
LDPTVAVPLNSRILPLDLDYTFKTDSRDAIRDTRPGSESARANSIGCLSRRKTP